MNKYFFHNSTIDAVKEILNIKKISYTETSESEYCNKRYSILEIAATDSQVKEFVMEAKLRPTTDYTIPEVEINITDKELSHIILHNHGYFARIKK